ncbi:bifunctional DNA primase/polymerase [Pseudonocardia sp. DLS-67]
MPVPARERYLLYMALRIANGGARVFPLSPRRKVPALSKDWLTLATRDPAQLRQWWRDRPYNIGVVTGGPSGLVVIDLDAPPRIGEPHGRQVLADLAREAGEEIPADTRIVNTPSGGQHLYFRLPDGLELRNTAGFLGPHIDTRASGGYVVGPGSFVHKGRYRLVSAADPQPLPGWLLDRLRPRTPTAGRGGSVVGARVRSAYVAAAVRGEVERVVRAGVGSRNDTLFRASARLGAFVAEGGLSEPEAWRVLRDAAAGHLRVAGFSASEIDRTIRSGLTRASRAPIPTSHRPGLRRDGPSS